MNDHDTECFSKINKKNKKISLYIRVDKRIRYNYFRSIQLFKRELMELESMQIIYVI